MPLLRDSDFISCRYPALPRSCGTLLSLRCLRHNRVAATGSGQFPTRSGTHEVVTKPCRPYGTRRVFPALPSTAPPACAGLDYFAPPALFFLRLVPPMQPRTAFRNSLLRSGLTSCRRRAAGSTQARWFVPPRSANCGCDTDCYGTRIKYVIRSLISQWIAPLDFASDVRLRPHNLSLAIAGSRAI